MKSKINDLVLRGWVDETSLNDYSSLKVQAIPSLLKSKIPSERTVSAKLISKRNFKQYIPDLCEALKKEKKLYTKLAICEAISDFGKDSIQYLIPLLGIISNNQYKEIPHKIFEKINYPLPRDIAARIIIRIGDAALPYLNKIILNGNRVQILEAVDAIGFISYYSGNTGSLQLMIKLYKTSVGNDELLEWKIVRALEAFNNSEVISILQHICVNHKNESIRAEAARSLKQIKNKKK
jgi:HEAT repeat protein